MVGVVGGFPLCGGKYKKGRCKEKLITAGHYLSVRDSKKLGVANTLKFLINNEK